MKWFWLKKMMNKEKTLITITITHMIKQWVTYDDIVKLINTFNILIVEKKSMNDDDNNWWSDDYQICIILFQLINIVDWWNEYFINHLIFFFLFDLSISGCFRFFVSLLVEWGISISQSINQSIHFLNNKIDIINVYNRFRTPV